MPRKYTPREIMDQFFAKVDRDGPWLKSMNSPCWIWFGSRGVHGYGHLAVSGIPYRAHRFSYFLHYGKHVPKNMCALHKCDNPCCVNPEHIFIGTQGDNVSDMDTKGRRKVCLGDSNGSRKHISERPRGQAHGRTKFTNQDVIEIRKMPFRGYVIAALAKKYGTTRAPIRAIMLRKTWKHI